MRVVNVRDQYGSPGVSGWYVINYETEATKRFPTRRKARQHRAGLKAKPAPITATTK